MGFGVSKHVILCKTDKPAGLIQRFKKYGFLFDEIKEYQFKYVYFKKYMFLLYVLSCKVFSFVKYNLEFECLLWYFFRWKAV